MYENAQNENFKIHQVSFQLITRHGTNYDVTSEDDCISITKLVHVCDLKNVHLKTNPVDKLIPQ